MNYTKIIVQTDVVRCGLTETEKEEQKQLRNEYRMAVINNLHSSLNNVSIENEDGTITELKTKVITKEIRNN